MGGGVPGGAAMGMRPAGMAGPISSGVRRRKEWTRAELIQNFGQLHQSVLQETNAEPFLEPVDPIKLGIPDYFDVIKKPMDLQTIGRKLENGDYHDPWEYCDDMRLMFDNARLYNKKSHRIYRMTNDVRWEFI